ncbi:MAG: hypothetical protein HY247_07330 [archaeon]|nr:MAG: hypothetical protein HY247_07330 [archaeon]
MVEIEYRPYQKIVVHEVKKVDVPGFFQGVIAQVEAQKQSGVPAVSWIDGVAFVIVPFGATPETVEENLKGIVHYALVLFTETSFQEEKKVTMGGREFVVKLAKADSNPNLVELVKFLKSWG